MPIPKIGKRIAESSHHLAVGWQWLFLALINMLGSIALTVLFTAFYTFVHEHWNLLPQLPDQTWTNFLVGLAFLCASFMFEIILIARSTISEIEEKATAAIRETLPAALSQEHLREIVQDLFSGVDDTETARTSGRSIVRLVRNFAQHVPDKQRPLLLWLLSYKLREFMAKFRKNLESGDFVIYRSEEVDAIDFQLTIHKRFSCAEPEIPDVVDKQWSEDWRKLLSTFESRGITGSYYFITTRETVTTKRKSFAAVARYVEKHGVEAYWCDLDALLNSCKIAALNFDALEWYEDDIFIRFSGLEEKGEWLNAKHIAMNIGEIDHDVDVTNIIRYCRKFSVKERDLVTAALPS